ncbi:MAG: hypothetical protein ACK4MI_03380 [Brevundimonas sp.]|uniref:hypothetical protein n=1 Tax=Brevundimonas sp. TaxID=1871086 RepID=UPI00391CA80A
MTQTPTDALRLVPVEPTEAVLTNMAIRFDHGLGCPGYYDNPIFGEPNHARRFEAAKTTMRQLYEEVVLSAAAPASPLPVGGQLSKNLGELKSEQCSGISGELKSPDLGALEKLADEATPGEWTIYETGRAEYKNLTWYVERNPPCDHPFISEVQVLPNAAFIAAANPATIKALIAELKEARGLLQGFVDDEDDAVTNPIGGLSLGGLMDARDNLGCVYQSEALAGHISQARAFLARNGKGEG